MAQETTGGALTLPQLFRQSAKKHGARTARMFKRDGAWLTQSWETWASQVDDIARGLVARGLQVDERAGLLSNSRAEWATADIAIMTAGGVTIPIYPSSLPDQVEYILDNSESRVVFVEDAKQLAKVTAVRERLPRLEYAVLLDGAVPADAPQRADGGAFVITLDDLVKQGFSASKQELDDRVQKGDPAKIATIVYTSGTTGPPKGVMQTHANHYWAAANVGKLGLLTPDDVDLLFLPLAHSFARLEELGQLYVGYTTAYAESIEKLIPNLAEVRPTVLMSVPRIYEKLYAAVQAKASQSPFKKKVFTWAVAIGRQVSQLKQQSRPIPFGLGLQYGLAKALFFKKVTALLGGRLRFCVSGGAALARDIGEFMHAAGVLVLEGYGLTETCPILTCNSLEAYRFGTVGKPIPGVEIKFGPDKEIIGRGPNVALGYYKREDATKEVFLEGGWFATGDIGELDADGFLKITDRKKDLIKTSGGKYVAPQEVEGRLKGDPFVAQCMVHGDNRKFCSVVIIPNRERLEAWAKEQGLPTASYDDLVRHERTKAHFQTILDRVNKGLASYEQPKKLVLGTAEWTPEGGELTPTLKVKRKVVTEKFKAELDALYAGDAAG